jgi:lipopolysaccharide transport system ATP-binding protein
VESVIRARDVGKKYRRYSADRPFTLQEAVVKGLRGLRPEDYHWALRGLTFDVRKGSMIGVVGHNGAGKSTLLRLLGGVGRPDEGRLAVDGVVGGLLDIGVGFHPDLTGKENVYVNGVVSGLLRSEVDARFADIVAFAELEDVINDPLRTYSAGMQMRLGFAVIAHTAPDILLIDEVLAVGDVGFQLKCVDHIRRLQKAGKTIVYVSHNSDQIREMCDDAILLWKGEMIQHGRPEDVMTLYHKQMKVEV